VRTAIVILVASAVVAFGNLLGPLPWGARVELRVLRRPLLRLAVIQAFAQSLAFAGLWTTRSNASFSALAAAAAILLALVAWTLASRVQATPRRDRG
jgi:hypothetical protein